MIKRPLNVSLPQDLLPASYSTGSMSVQFFLPWVCVGTHSSWCWTEEQHFEVMHKWKHPSVLGCLQLTPGFTIASITQVHPVFSILLPGMKMERSSCHWKQTSAMKKQKRMSPTCPTTIWSRLKPTSWNEPDACRWWLVVPSMSDTYPSVESNYAMLLIPATLRTFEVTVGDSGGCTEHITRAQQQHAFVFVRFMWRHRCASSRALLFFVFRGISGDVPVAATLYVSYVRAETCGLEDDYTSAEIWKQSNLLKHSFDLY